MDRCESYSAVELLQAGDEGVGGKGTLRDADCAGQREVGEDRAERDCRNGERDGGCSGTAQDDQMVGNRRSELAEGLAAMALVQREEDRYRLLERDAVGYGVRVARDTELLVRRRSADS